MCHLRPFLRPSFAFGRYQYSFTEDKLDICAYSRGRDDLCISLIVRADLPIIIDLHVAVEEYDDISFGVPPAFISGFDQADPLFEAEHLDEPFGEVARDVCVQRSAKRC